MTPVVQARGLARWYGQVVGVNDLEADIGPGITGLLGPNGAGKSTFIQLLCGQLKPSRGTIRVLDMDPFANGRLFRRLGYCPDQDVLYDDMTGLQFVTFMMRLHGFAPGEARERARRALEQVGLADAMGRPAGGYSRGMRQRTRLAQAIGHGPEILILDEPLNGLDPVARRHVVDLLCDWRDQGVHILLSSHVLHEVEHLTRTILLIHRGRILADGTVSEIRGLLDKHPRKIRFKARDARRLACLLMNREEVMSVHLEAEGGTLLVETTNIEALHRALPEIVADESPGVVAMESTDAGLEAVFDYLVG